jgi:hypothetical protein
VNRPKPHEAEGVKRRDLLDEIVIEPIGFAPALIVALALASAPWIVGLLYAHLTTIAVEERLDVLEAGMPLTDEEAQP